MTKPRHIKLLQGTLRPHRDAGEAPPPLPYLDVLPDAPSWLPNAAAATEYRRLGAVMLANGLLHAGNIGHLTILAALYGRIVQLFMAGEPPQAALVGRFQALASELGLTGIARTTATSARPNKFSTNGRKP